MENVNEISQLVQEAINVFCKSKRFEEEVLTIAQKLGLQGEKRRLRYESAKHHNLINFLICDAFDVYGVSLKRIPVETNIPVIATIESFFTTCLTKMESQYNALHTIANKLVVLNAQHVAKRLYDCCCCLIEDIKYYRRIIREGSATSWKPEFIFLHQTTACNVHDTYEKKEAEIFS
jgi:hypothetical protein